MSFYRCCLFVLCLGLGASTTAAELERNLSRARPGQDGNDKRVALVIGNSSYKSLPLINPVNDAQAISARLKSLGFTVIERQNLSIKQIGPTLREFRSKLSPGGVALFFYAGHGLQVQGANYLPVVDADIASEEDVSLQSLEVGKVLQLMDEAKTRLNLVFLDACRNNPYARSFRSAAGGLARINAPSGTLISFATRPGSVASDGSGRNGLYTEKLLQAMNDTGTPIELVLKKVVSGVKSASNGRQEPWMEGSIEGDFCFDRCSGLAGVADKPAASGQVALEVAFWESVRDGSRAELQAYLDKFPNGQFAGLAKSKLERQQQGLVALIEAAPKPYPSAPLTRTPSGLPVLYAPAAVALKTKISDSQAAQLLASYRGDADAGNAIAQFSLGSVYMNGLGVPENKVEAYDWTRKAAEQGLAVAQNNVGNGLLHGIGTSRNEAEAVEWFQRSAEQNLPVAQMNLGILYASGQAVAKNLELAFEWMRKAAEQGLPTAQARLATIYLSGQGVAKDESAAMRWAHKAADAGDGLGEFIVGDAYRLGYAGVKQNYAEAVKWYRRAADQGVPNAMNNMGFCYENGYGVEKDRSQAIDWYRKAAAKGAPTAKDNLKRLGVE